MEDKNYVTVLGWMFKLSLTPSEVMVFAIVYSFSRDGKSTYFGSTSFLCELLGVSKNTAIKILKTLVDKKLIIKDVNSKGNINFNEYKANQEVIQNLNRG